MPKQKPRSGEKKTADVTKKIERAVRIQLKIRRPNGHSSEFKTRTASNAMAVVADVLMDMSALVPETAVHTKFRASETADRINICDATNPELSKEGSIVLIPFARGGTRDLTTCRDCRIVRSLMAIYHDEPTNE